MIVTKQMANADPVKDKDKWRTPPHIFNPLNEIFNFGLDPCCDNREEALCSYFFTPAENGLTVTWAGMNVFCNPPYSRGKIEKWVEKCYKESLKEQTIVVALLPVSTSAIWWHRWLINKACLIYVERRIKFIGAKYTAPFSSVITLFGGNQTGSFNQKTGKLQLPENPNHD